MSKFKYELKLFTFFSSIAIAIFGITILPLIIPEFFPKYTETVDAIQIMSIVIGPSTIALILESQFLGSEKSKVVLIGAIISLVILICGRLSGLVKLRQTRVSLTHSILMLIMKRGSLSMVAKCKRVRRAV